MNEVYSTTSKRDLMGSVLKAFALSLLVAVLGMLIGTQVPPVLFMPLIIIEFVMLLAAFFARKRKSVGYGFLYAFTFISGITTYPIIAHYLAASGGQVVLSAFTATLVIFAVMSFIGTTTKKDLSFLSGFLMTALLALIVIGVINLFSPFSSTALFVASIIGTVVFSLYIMYDFNRMKNIDFTEEAIPLLALNLYLDFINLFLNLLRFFGFISRD
ncbi:Bax inhibitor-1/YccA family protein [Heyndrickxia sp. NPDC080065]|uniref:Bax inhibitor-1/YccA family protein n=1 Tax=Heyndrickxia sp. NPDC080065 TaxID=3390568 RepID=UPI003D01231A